METNNSLIPLIDSLIQGKHEWKDAYTQKLMDDAKVTSIITKIFDIIKNILGKKVSDQPKNLEWIQSAQLTTSHELFELALGLNKNPPANNETYFFALRALQQLKEELSKVGTGLDKKTVTLENQSTSGFTNEGILSPLIEQIDALSQYVDNKLQQNFVNQIHEFQREKKEWGIKLKDKPMQTYLSKTEINVNENRDIKELLQNKNIQNQEVELITESGATLIAQSAFTIDIERFTKFMLNGEILCDMQTNKLEKAEVVYEKLIKEFGEPATSRLSLLMSQSLVADMTAEAIRLGQEATGLDLGARGRQLTVQVDNNGKQSLITASVILEMYGKNVDKQGNDIAGEPQGYISVKRIVEIPLEQVEQEVFPPLDKPFLPDLKVVDFYSTLLPTLESAQLIKEIL
jgi:hypothetical protein